MIMAAAGFAALGLIGAAMVASYDRRSGLLGASASGSRAGRGSRRPVASSVDRA